MGANLITATTLSMYSPARLAIKYLQYYVTALNGKGHGMHSPFVFRMIRDVFMDKKEYPEYAKAEALRADLLRDERLLAVADLGAGSSTGAGSSRQVKSIAKHAAKPRKLARLLFRIARHYGSQHILELGTSLGITSAYFSLAQPSATVTTMEGAPAIAQCAKENFQKLGLGNIQLIEGNFDETLQPAMAQLPAQDLIFLDGNHRLEPTVRYFEQLLPFIHDGTIVILDDIHWSPEMEQAWQQVISHERVRCSIDLFFIGIVLFRPAFHEKQHFTIRF